MSLSLGQTGLSHVAISCKNIEISIHFYCQVLGFKVNESLGRNKGNIKINVSSGSYIELFPFEMYQSSDQGALVHFALDVSSLKNAMDFLESKGVSIIRGPFDIKGLEQQVIARKIAFIQGPDGEEIELVESI